MHLGARMRATPAGRPGVDGQRRRDPQDFEELGAHLTVRSRDDGHGESGRHGPPRAFPRSRCLRSVT